jgi:CIC family chloride channel protein
MLILSLLAGAFGGFSAIILKNAVFFIHGLLIHDTDKTGFNLIYLILPITGIALTYLFVRYFVRDAISHGVSRILFAISRNNSIIKAHNMFTSLISSAITVGFGGSVGLEAPIVVTGSAIGSNLSKFLRLDYHTTTLLVGCGAAGAIAAIFKAPIAAVIFALEVLMLDLTMASLIPLLISAATGTTLAYFLMGRGFLFTFQVSDVPFRLANLPFYALLGVLTGFVSIYFTKANLSIERQFQKIPSGFVKMLIGGLITGLLVFLFPPLYGEGYDTLSSLLNGKGDSILDHSLFSALGSNYLILILFLVLLLIFKVVAMSATTGGGGIGGIFAPSLFMGGITGYFLSKLVNFFQANRLPESNFALAGMAGIMAAVMHAPLTAIFLIAEITGGYSLFIPLIVTSIVAYLTIIPFEPHSIYTKRLAAQGELITHDKDKSVLNLLSIEKLIETNFSTVSPEITLGEFVKVVSKSQRNVFPVVNEDNLFLGVVFINDIREIIFKPELYESTYVSNLMFMPDAFIDKDATMEDVARKFHETSHYNIPVLDHGKYVGFVSRANVFSAYREMVKDFSKE